MPLFSIIIPVYNVQNYLSACVKSVVEQPGPRDWECILVDDGSTDQSGAMCDALAAELPGLQVIHRENGGLAAARNTGLKAATGDWLLFLDSDDAMAPGLLEQLRGALTAHPDCGSKREVFTRKKSRRGMGVFYGIFPSAYYVRARVARSANSSTIGTSSSTSPSRATALPCQFRAVLSGTPSLPEIFVQLYPRISRMIMTDLYLPCTASSAPRMLAASPSKTATCTPISCRRFFTPFSITRTASASVGLPGAELCGIPSIARPPKPLYSSSSASRSRLSSLIASGIPP